VSATRRGMVPEDLTRLLFVTDPQLSPDGRRIAFVVTSLSEERDEPIEQAEQLFVALKKLRREVRFVRFPGENHEMSRSGKPRHRLERFRHILEWFAGHLGRAQS